MVIVTRLMTFIAVMIGYLLLFVPGVVIAVAWSMAVPVIVAEGVGAPNCFSRSADLTRGFRWAIFWLAFISTVASVVFGYGVGLLIAIIERALRPGVSIQVLVLFSGCATALVGAVARSVNGVGLGVIYRELIQIKRGASAKTIATVFD